MKKPSSSACHSLQHTVSFPMQMGVPKSLYFVCSLRVCLGRNGTMCTIMGLQMLSEAPLVPLKHLGKVMKHSNSNGCLTSQYSNAFSMRRGYLESPHFVYNLRVELGKNGTVWTIGSSYMLPKAPLIFLIYLWKVMKHPNSNGCLYLQHSIPFHVCRRYQNSGILHTNWETTLAKLSWYEP